jgi:hypothetical protein
MTRVEALFGEDDYQAWASTIARAALYTLTDEHQRHAASQAQADARYRERYADVG